MTGIDSLAHIIARKCADTPDLDVLTFVDVSAGGQLVSAIRSYADLWRNSQRLARALVATGVEPQESFAIILQNHPEFVEAMTASAIVNSIFVPVDPRMTGNRLVHMLVHSECTGAIIGDYSLSALETVLDRTPALAWIWVLDTGLGARLPSDPRFRWLADVGKDGPDLPIAAANPLDPMQMLYTSGTTGDPKAILMPYARFAAISGLGATIGLTPGDRPYTGLSLTHANAQLITLGNILHMGLRGVISRKFTKSRLWDIARQHGCTMFNLLGGMTTAIFSEPERPDDADNPVRYVLSAGMTAALWDKFRTRFEVDVFEFYGAAEGGLTLNPPGTGPAGSIGKPPPNLICAILDDKDRECAPNKRGEICFRNADGSPLAVKYFKDPAASEAKTRDGWFRSGDIGHRDESGWLYFDHRAGSGIRLNGDFIDTPLIEKTMAEHPAVSDVFIYGAHLSHNAPGEKEIIAAIVPASHHPLDVPALFTHCAVHLPANFVPAFIQVVSVIPKTASEKPQERFLLADFEQHGGNIHTRKG